MSTWLRRSAVVGATLAASVLTFEVSLRVFRPGWHSREHLAILAWTVPLALLVLAAAKPLRRRLAHRGALVRGIIGVVSAALLAIAWTIGAVALTGGYALAFDANPLWCWFAGGLAGIGTSVFWPDMTRTAVHAAPDVRAT